MKKPEMRISEIMKNIQNLTPREQKIITWYYKDKKSSKEIAELFNVSTARIGQIKLRGIKKLKMLGINNKTAPRDVTLEETGSEN